MLATTGFENKQQVKIYENQIVTNQTEIDIAKGKNDEKNFPIPSPIVETKAYIEAVVPQSKSGYNGPLTDDLKKNFPETWKAFQNKQTNVKANGSPLSMIPDLSTSLIKTINDMGITTLEQLSDVSDTTAQRLPMGLKMREKAKLILKSLDDTKLDKTIDELAEMREVIAAQQAQIEALKKPKKEVLTKAG